LLGPSGIEQQDKTNARSRILAGTSGGWGIGGGAHQEDGDCVRELPAYGLRALDVQPEHHVCAPLERVQHLNRQQTG
jgi:hypothetical protein